jgi:hypothetical protein
MAKELPYFRFTVSEWLNKEIHYVPFNLKGVFADACAHYWFNDCSITRAELELRLNNAKSELDELIKKNIIKATNENDFLEIYFLNEQFDILSNTRKARQDAGSKGGKQKSSNARNLLKQKCSYKDKDKDNDKDNIGKRFIIPSIEEIQAYIKEKNYTDIDPVKWWHFYNGKDWYIGKNKMRNWHSAIATWHKEPQKKPVQKFFNAEEYQKKLMDEQRAIDEQREPEL